MSINFINLLVGIILTFLVGITIDIFIYFDLDKDFVTFAVLISVNIILLYVYPEKFTLNNIWAYVFPAMTLALIYYYISYTIYGTNISITNSYGVLGFFIYFINISVLIPLYEEIIVRKLIFISGKKYIGMPASAIITSLIFAMTHDSMFVWAFILSIVLCVMTDSGINVYKRSIFHGSYNLTFSLILLRSANII